MSTKIKSHKCLHCGTIYDCRCQQQHRNRPAHYDCGKCEKVSNEPMDMSPAEKMRILTRGKEPR